MTDSALVQCPSCLGECKVDTGDIYTDPGTGTRSLIMVPCDTCGGTGAVEDPDYDGPNDFHTYNGLGLEGGIHYDTNPTKLR